jgi:hypothetical protein
MLCTPYALVMNEYPPEWHYCDRAPHPLVGMENQLIVHELKLVVLVAYLSTK